MQRPAHFVAVAALAALLAAPLPAVAQGEIQFETVQYQGTYQGVVPGGVMVGTPGGPTVLLPEGLSFTVGGQRIDLGGYAIGSPVLVTVPGGAGQVVGLNGDLLALMLPSGAVQVPVSLISAPVQQKTKVRVLKKNGKVVTVPLNAALNMQRAQGAVILGNCPAWQPATTGPVVVVGSQGENILLSTVVNGAPRFYTVPRSKAGRLAGVGAGTPVEVGPGFVVSDWKPGHGHGQSGQGDDKGKSSEGKGKSDNAGGKGGQGKGKNK